MEKVTALAAKPEGKQPLMVMMIPLLLTVQLAVLKLALAKATVPMVMALSSVTLIDPPLGMGSSKVAAT